MKPVGYFELQIQLKLLIWPLNAWSNVLLHTHTDISLNLVWYYLIKVKPNLNVCRTTHFVNWYETTNSDTWVPDDQAVIEISQMFVRMEGNHWRDKNYQQILEGY
jgi:hypothetical protein